MKATKILALTAVLLPLAFVSCSKDEDKDKSNVNGSSSQSSSVSVIKTDDGVMTVLKGINDRYGDRLSFGYDSEGRCVSIYEGEESEDWLMMGISHDPFALTFNEDGITIDASLNSSGYLDKVSFCDEYSGDYYNYSGEGICTYSYDGSFLTKVSVNYSEAGTENGEKYQNSGVESAVFTWASGNVKKIEYSEKWTIESDNYTYTYNITAMFDYGDEKNEYLQYTYALWDYLVDYCGLDDFGFIGYLGKGTALLPVSCEYEYEDYEEYNGNESHYAGGSTYSFDYTKNGDGLIKTETNDGRTFTYSYDYISPETRSMMTLPYNESTAGENTGQHRRMFDRRGQHHSPHYRSVHSHEE